MKKKKNNFLLFCFSLVPGAGEMYLGFMKMGVSLMGLFMLSIALTSYTNMGVLAFAIVVIWTYSFFHANNLGGLSDEQFYQMEDTYLFGAEEGTPGSLIAKYRKVLAAILIVLGVSMLWQTFCDLLRFAVGEEFYRTYVMQFTRLISQKVPRFVIGVAIIWLGIHLIKGKKAELDKLEMLENRAETGMEAEAETQTGKDAGGDTV